VNALGPANPANPADSDDPIAHLALELGRLPGVGERSAARLAYYIIKVSCPAPTPGGPTLAGDLAAALNHVAKTVGLCGACQNLCAAERCAICCDARRDPSILCVVEGVADLRAIEQSGVYRGLYHVLHGALAPLDGIGPAELKLPELLHRLRDGQISEVILATGTHVEGDATALYLARLIKPLAVRVTRPAAGIPLGGELEYLDQGTLGRAFTERRDF
jgi:recombination protein RecR